MLSAALRQSRGTVQNMAPKIQHDLDRIDLSLCRTTPPAPARCTPPNPKPLKPQPRRKLMLDCEKILPNIPIAKLCWDPEQNWHKEIIPGIRIHLVRKVLKALLAYRPYSAIEDKSLLETYLSVAASLESSTFTTATDRTQYYKLISEEIFRIYQTKTSLKAGTDCAQTVFAIPLDE